MRAREVRRARTEGMTRETADAKIAQLVAEGMDRKQIARMMGIAQKDVAAAESAARLGLNRPKALATRRKQVTALPAELESAWVEFFQKVPADPMARRQAAEIAKQQGISDLDAAAIAEAAGWKPLD